MSRAARPCPREIRIPKGSAMTRPPARDSSRPSSEEVLTYFDSLSNWGRWGPDDRLGTLNLITPGKRLQAASLVRDGRSVPLSRDMDPEHPDPLGRGTVLQRFMQLDEVGHQTGGGSARFNAVREYVGVVGHGSHTHLDGLAHFSWDGRNYNGVPASATTSWGGATELSVHHAKDGIVTRGVLLDIPALHGLRRLPAGHAITLDDLEAAEERQQVTVGAGDALLVRTGHLDGLASGEERPAESGGQPGLSAACLPYLRERDVALLGMDGQQDQLPSGYDTMDLFMPVHAVGIVALGLWLLDNAELAELATACAEAGRWEFFFALLPWRLKGVTSCPTNPIALL
jgi:kynurenine formamidase